MPNKCDKASVFRHMIDEFKLIFSEASVGKIIGMIVRGENLFYLMKNLLNISNRLVSKEMEGRPAEIGPREKDSWANSIAKYVSGLIKMIITI